MKSMLKVFLVEDEYVIREAIRTTVDWNANGFELSGEAGDGEKACQMILKCRPDVLITDIRMPFMDGLELSRLVRRKLPETKIVIISGYDDFSYAKEAISIGVTEYLLKPVTEAKLLETLGRVRESIEAERRQLSFREVYEAERAELQKLEKHRFIRDLIDGRIETAEALEKGQGLGLDLTSDWYQVLLVQFVPGGDGEGRAASDEAAAAIVDRADSLPFVGVCEQLGGVLCLLLMAETHQELRQRAEAVVSAVEEAAVSAARGTAASEVKEAAASGAKELLYFVSLGEPVSRIRELRLSWEDASRRFARRFLSGESRVFSFEDPKEKEESPFSLSDFDIGKIDRRLVFNFLKSGAEADVQTFVRDCFMGLGTVNQDSLLLRCYIVMDAYLTTASFLRGAGMTGEEIEALVGRLMNPEEVGSAASAADYLCWLFRRALAERDRRAEAEYGSMIAEVKQWIYRNFERSDISLSEAAEAVHVSPNHLSRIFSRKTGNTFVGFLTEVRIEKARELLQRLRT